LVPVAAESGAAARSSWARGDIGHDEILIAETAAVP
jgi:hypothetical protein